MQIYKNLVVTCIQKYLSENRLKATSQTRRTVNQYHISHVNFRFRFIYVPPRDILYDDWKTIFWKSNYLFLFQKNISLRRSFKTRNQSFGYTVPTIYVTAAVVASTDNDKQCPIPEIIHHFLWSPEEVVETAQCGFLTN